MGRGVPVILAFAFADGSISWRFRADGLAPTADGLSETGPGLPR